MTRVLEFFGGPGTGKSTSAALAYYLLKQAGKNVELVREYVKDWAWEGRKITDYDQIYFVGKQVRRESLLYGKVDYIVTDSPVLMNVFYANKYCPEELAVGVEHIVSAFYKKARQDGVKHERVLLRRSKPYNPAGRFQTEDQAKAMDAELADLVKPWTEYDYWEFGTDELEIKLMLEGMKILER